MRKFLMTAAAAALVVTAFAAPITAQDAVDTSTMTIAEIATALSTADVPEFSVLMTAVGLADPAVAAALSDPELQLTVFAPTDAAFNALAEALGEETFAAILADQTALSNILAYHVIPGRLDSASIVGAVTAVVGMEMGAGLTYSVETLLGESVDFRATETGVSIDGANIVLESVDIPASNGLIHVIDAVLLPAQQSVGELVVASASAETPQFTVLLAAVEALGLTETVLDPESDLTVFAPTDAAFAAAFEALGVTAEDVLADTELLAAIVTYHIVPGSVTSGDLIAALVPDMMSGVADAETPEWNGGLNEEGTGLLVNTANGAQLTFTLNEAGVPFIDAATIVANDIDATNGVIHVIDSVLLPPLE
ncbi:MAG: fasciclin domain-containing protein [Pleurocapsa minor GSE-CHR-MK-17-07R]|jgi:uncharacterized surface protein with fasciclin (FAS1) repeats|nr:fasciclin domain-containing protein [Pleurocapsa minor GSE-CHR-MK 17-07R]